MRTNSKIIRIALWVLLGIALFVSNLALNRSFPSIQGATVTPATQSGTLAAQTEALDELGSTDGIMFMAALIVLIVIIPILLKRQDWSNGKRK